MTTYNLKFKRSISLSLSILTIITFGIAIATPPISGSFCQSGCIDYPYTDILSRFPRDYYWMFPAVILTMIYLIFMACLNSYADERKKIFGQIALSFAGIASLILILNYFIQLTVIQSSLLNGETEAIPLWTQYNSNGLFIAMEEIAYIMMSFSFLFAAFIFGKTYKTENILRIILIIAFSLSIAALILIAVKYGHHKGYMYEIIVISVNWLTFILIGFLAMKLFNRKKT